MIKGTRHTLASELGLACLLGGKKKESDKEINERIIGGRTLDFSQIFIPSNWRFSVEL